MYPATYLGDSAASTDISMPEFPDGYYLTVQRTGRGDLGRTVDGERHRLAQGFAGLPAGAWYTIAISFAGNRIRAIVDGVEVAAVTDDTYSHGRAGIGTGCNRVQF